MSATQDTAYGSIAFFYHDQTMELTCVLISGKVPVASRCRLGLFCSVLLLGGPYFLDRLQCFARRISEKTHLDWHLICW